MEFYTIEQLGKKQELTPEGFLLCRDVPIARTGTQIYTAREVPELEAGNDGLIVMERDEAEVFRPATVDSVNGKPVTVDHPNDLVSPQAWRDLAVGVVVNARRGKGVEDDLLLADLLITDKDAIEQVRETKGQEVSAGYSYDAVQVSKGRGKQTNIWINHIALVDQARCGVRCSIKDSDSLGEKMTVKDVIAKLKTAWDKKDCKAFDAGITALDEATEVHLHNEGRSAYDDDTLKKLFEDNDAKHVAMDERMKEVEGKFAAQDARMKDAEEEAKKKEAEDKARDAEKEKEENEMKDALADEAPAGKEEEAKTAKDSSYLVESFQATKAKAEIIAPGIHFPAFDKAAPAKDSFMSICTLRRKALQKASFDAESAEFLKKLNGKAFDNAALNKVSCGRVKAMFDSLAEMKTLANNARATRERPNLAALTQNNGAPVNAENFKTLRDQARKEKAGK